MLFRSTEVNGDFGRLGVAALDDLAHPQYTSLSCERVAFDADRGLCLVADRGAITTYKSVIFDQHFHTLFSVALAGLPSRARVSHDGRYGATTTFVFGDSYAGTSYSTRTELYDLRSGKRLGDLEQFTTLRDGHAIDAIDRNLWGVTFDPTDSNRFYATEKTGGQYYLVVGDITARRMVVLRSGVECPSISPDGKEIAFKARHTGALGRVEWRLSVLDVATLADHPVAETRSVDDQAAMARRQHPPVRAPESLLGDAGRRHVGGARRRERPCHRLPPGRLLRPSRSAPPAADGRAVSATLSGNLKVHASRASTSTATMAGDH